MKGRFFSNIFIHFKPIGPSDGAEHVAEKDGVPIYIVPGSREARNWKEEHEEMDNAVDDLIEATKDFDFEAVQNILTTDETGEMIHQRDENGWQPLHEAARGGSAEMARFLVRHGADVDERTHEGTGGSPLYVAVETWGDASEIARYLREEAGAQYIAPATLLDDRFVRSDG